MHTLLEALKNSVLITGLVMIMMILIEYINIQSHGESFRKLKNSNFRQVLLAAGLGLIPGCVGGFAVVSLYTHRLLSFGALVAMMISSSGDEAFIMLALIPKTAIILFASLFVVGIIAGVLVDKFVKKEVAPFDPNHYEIHENCCDSHSHSKRGIFNSTFGANFAKVTKERALILAGIALFIAAVVMGLLEHDHSAHGHEFNDHAGHSSVVHSNTSDDPNSFLHAQSIDGQRVCIQDELHEGHDHAAHNHDHTGTTHNHDHTGTTHDHDHAGTTHDHDHAVAAHVHDQEQEYASHTHGNFNIFSERWINLIFAGLSLIVLFMTAKANEHFIKEHLWNHVVKKHLKSIFLWTFGALLVIHYGMQFLHLEDWIANNIFLVILLAAAIGLIPESGPHMIFITLFAGGMVPFSVLMVSSIVQDGHTALPLLAESKKSFAKAKLINMCIGIIVGILLHFTGL